MQITKKLPPISLSGNLTDLIITATASELISVKLFNGTKMIIDENYQPDANLEIKIRYKDIISRLLNLSVPPFATGVYSQKTACVEFTVKLSSTSGQTDSFSFKVIKGRVDTDLLNTDTFLKTNFLTWQPQAKHVQYHDPEWLTYYAQEDCYLRIKAFCSPSKTFVTKTFASLPAGQLSSVNLNYGLIVTLFATDGIPAYYDVFVEKAGVRLSYVQRFILSQEEHYFNDVFVFENSVGGVDTIRFTGEAKDKPDFAFDNAWFDEVKLDYEMLPDYVVEKNTGYFRTNDEKIWSADFFGSLQKYKTDSGSLLRIYTMDPDLDSIKGELTDYNFNYSYSKISDSMNLSRKYEAPPELALPGDIVGTVVELAPRINQYPWATNTDVLFPVQYPYESAWRKLSLKEVVSSIVIGGSPGADGGAGGNGNDANNGIFGSWIDLDNKNILISSEDLSLQFKTDFPSSSTKLITYLAGQFFIKPEFVGTSILIGVLPSGNRPQKKITQYFITANIEMFLTVDKTGEVMIISKDGFNLPTGSQSQDYYFINIFFKSGAKEQINFTGKWIIDTTESYCEPAQSTYVWGKIFEENRETINFPKYTFADIYLKTYKGSATAPPANLDEPISCNAAAISISYSRSDRPDQVVFNVFMNNEQSIKLKPDPSLPKPIVAAPVDITFWCAFSGQAKDTWKLIEKKNASGNTGYQINPKLLWVSNDADQRPLDVNNNLCIVTGLPQKSMINPPDAANYRTLNLKACPI